MQSHRQWPNALPHHNRNCWKWAKVMNPEILSGYPKGTLFSRQHAQHTAITDTMHIRYEKGWLDKYAMILGVYEGFA